MSLVGVEVEVGVGVGFMFGVSVDNRVRIVDGVRVLKWGVANELME
jgi:hypothetical protein